MKPFKGARGVTGVRKISAALAGLVMGFAMWSSACSGLTGSSSTKTNTPATLTISNPTASSITSTSATITWQTSAAANSQVMYGTTTSYGSSTTLDAAMVMSHQESMSGLKAGTLYHYQLHSTDASGNQATSSDLALTTASGTDTTPPTVSITAPAGGATVSGTITVTATASDNVGVAGVQFKVDGGNIGAEDTASPYSASLNTASLTNAAHTLTATARDAAGNVTTSASVSVTVKNTTVDTTPPTVSISAPANGATVSGTVTVTAAASDNVGVASVQFQLDNANVGSLDTTAPYTFSWVTGSSANGSHTLKAIAKDAAGNSATSAVVTVTVNNGTPDTTPPTVPASLAAAAISSSQINLTWTASTDNVGVAGYNIFRGGTKVASSSGPAFSDTGLTASTTFSYTVNAFDAAGNTSAQSGSASATTQAAPPPPPPPPGGGLPSSLGWYQIPNTQMMNVCPPGLNCANVIIPWSGGVADTQRNRLIVWGGGHTDYSGNEVYALNLGANPITLTRLNNPSTPSSSCVEALSDGTPPSRHTYDALTYFPDTDNMVSWAGSMNPTGCATETTWSLAFSNLAWTNKVPASGTGSQSGYPHGNGGLGASDYDPNTKNMYAFTEGFGQFASYNFNNNLWKALSNSNGISQEVTAVVDPKRKRFYAFGAGQTVYFDISGSDPTYSLHSMSGTSCAFAGGQAPGVAYDSVQDRIVGWSGGNTVNVYNPDTDSCTSVTYPNGPGAQQSLGTYGRFRYFPNLNVFALVNDAGQNAFALRLTAAQSSPDADFAARCNAPGVTKCVAFDTMGAFGAADVVRMDVDPNNGNLRARSDGQYRGTIDTTVKKSGIGSLRFQLDAGYAAANIAGEYIPNTNDGLGGRFGENSTFYVQYAVRFSPEMLSNLAFWDSNWKVSIFHMDQQSCAGKEITLVNHQGLSNYLWMYKDCGADTMTTLLDGQTWTPSNPPYLSQQGNYYCDYGNYTNCWSFPTNTWITMYYKIHVGNYEQPNSTIEAWYAVNGQPYVKWINVLQNFTIHCNGTAPCPTEVFNNLSLLTYMTGLSVPAPATAYTWYDELIVSTQPIAAPNN